MRKSRPLLTPATSVRQSCYWEITHLGKGFNALYYLNTRETFKYVSKLTLHNFFLNIDLIIEFIVRFDKS